MRCEVCGREISGAPLRRIIEGGRLMVCGECAQFSSGEWTPTRPRAPPKARVPRSEFEDLERLTLVEDFGRKIREARQREGLTVEDLAKKIGEKESVLKNLEKEELMPSEDLVKKLHNVLKIALLVSEEPSSAPKTSKPAGPRTLGDVIKLRQGPKEPSKEEEKEETS